MCESRSSETVATKHKKQHDVQVVIIRHITPTDRFAWRITTHT